MFRHRLCFLQLNKTCAVQVLPREKAYCENVKKELINLDFYMKYDIFI